MNKLIYIALAAACFSMAGCSNDDSPNVDRTTDDDWISEDGRVVIQLGGLDGGNAHTAITRSPILDNGSNFFYDEASIPENANTMGIFALAPQANWGSATDDPLLLNNIEAVGTTTTKNMNEGAQEDGLKKIKLKATQGSSSWGGIYYYPMVTKFNYSFYGYAPFQEGQTVSNGNSVINFNSFNGSQDIIYAKAEAAQVGADEIWINNRYEENTSPLNGYNAKYIRQLKYHYELNEDEGALTAAGKTKKTTPHPWVPNLEFKHKLAWLKFAVVVSSEQSQADKTEAQRLTVKDIKILDHGNKASLDILSGVLTFSGSETLKMKNCAGDSFSDDDAVGEYSPEDMSTPTVRGYLLVNPAATYKVQLTVVPPRNDAGVTPPQQTFDIELKLANGSFEAGKSYLIKLGIYAMQEVEATASVTRWGEDTVVEFPVE